jgi:hypothetical protein
MLGRGAARGAANAGVSAGPVERRGSARAMAGVAAAAWRVPRSSLSAPRAEGDTDLPLGTEAALGDATAVTPRDAAFAGSQLPGPATLEGAESGVTGPVVAAMSRAAGTDDVARGTDDAAARGAGGGAEGDRIAITIVRPTNPITTAATP